MKIISRCAAFQYFANYDTFDYLCSLPARAFFCLNFLLKNSGKEYNPLRSLRPTPAMRARRGGRVCGEKSICP
jgi:hypothetical protein